MRDFVEANGPIVVGEQALDFRPSTRDEVPVREAVQALLAAGVKPDEIRPLLSLTKAAIEDLVKDLPDKRLDRKAKQQLRRRLKDEVYQTNPISPSFRWGKVE